MAPLESRVSQLEESDAQAETKFTTLIETSIADAMASLNREIEALETAQGRQFKDLSQSLGKHQSALRSLEAASSETDRQLTGVEQTLSAHKDQMASASASARDALNTQRDRVVKEITSIRTLVAVTRRQLETSFTALAASVEQERDSDREREREAEGETRQREAALTESLTSVKGRVLALEDSTHALSLSHDKVVASVAECRAQCHEDSQATAQRVCEEYQTGVEASVSVLSTQCTAAHESVSAIRQTQTQHSEGVDSALKEM
ncbi:hypothetical protein KIPB_004925, partial [Kipferlia bialata]|eukprot:g4925.t1